MENVNSSCDKRLKLALGAFNWQYSGIGMHSELVWISLYPQNTPIFSVFRMLIY